MLLTLLVCTYFVRKKNYFCFTQQ